MYIPRSYAEAGTDRLHEFITAHPFAALITANDGLFATHLPLVLRPDVGTLGTLEGHVARANEHHKRVTSPSDALVIFSGPHAHVTPTWYPSKEESGKVVPTWNYVAVHVYGTVRFIDDPEFLRAHLARLTETHETARGSEWTTNDPPEEYVTQQLRAIVGVEIAITRVEGKWKMSQNRGEADIDGVVAGLRDSGNIQDAVVADIVANRRP
ncbi:MAG: FMN-binding negative transcriptional regulator [bacterium]